MIDLTPTPVAIAIGPFDIHWYGVAYAVGLAAAYAVIARQARLRGLDVSILPNAMIVVAVAALIGGRLYHVIDQWQLYQNDLPRIVLPPYSGLGVYGGIIAGTATAYVLARVRRQSFLSWADAVAPGLFVMQAIARWGNFFNQELYGAPTTLPWGLAIQCQNRTQGYPCPPGSDPLATLGQHFQPLFLYESVSGAVGAMALIWLARRFRGRLEPGDLLLVFFVWYGTVRIVLESLKANDWTFFGVPMAQIAAGATVVSSIVILALRHRRGHGPPGWSRGSPDQVNTSERPQDAPVGDSPASQERTARLTIGE